MFTGLIEAVGEVMEVAPIPAGFGVRISAPFAEDVTVGESIAVNGVCLTATGADGTSFSAEIGPETAAVTSLGGLRAGSLVNLERAMRPTGRFGGHFVLGHVDASGTIQSIRPEADFSWVTVGYPASIASYLIHRGSIAIDGISLTIARLDASSLGVQIVPFTWAQTNLRAARPGDRVNIECDVIGKYVVRALETAAVRPT